MVRELRPLGASGIEDVAEDAVVEHEVVGIGAIAGGERYLVGMNFGCDAVEDGGFVAKLLICQRRLEREPAKCRASFHSPVRAGSPARPWH